MGRGSARRAGTRSPALCKQPARVEARSAARLEERKVVSVLFCDLVGFTAMSEAADPEDVDRVLEAYGRMARSAIVAHGGVVEKFIGDAVVGVFGVPATHEDDALRAVRAGPPSATAPRACRRSVARPFACGSGSTPARPSCGWTSPRSPGERFMAGDAINTASRIQSVAPEQGVAVGEATCEATRTAVEYADLPPATLKGKAEPVRVFQRDAPHGTGSESTSRAPRAARSSAGQPSSTQLDGLFDRAVAATLPCRFALARRRARDGQEPARGRAAAPRRRGVGLPVTWRAGRCLPYGDGDHVLGPRRDRQGASRDPRVRRRRTRRDREAGRGLPLGAERAWLRERLLPLVGIE